MASLKRKQRVQLLIFGGVALGMSAALVAFAFSDSISFFVGPSKLLAEAESYPQTRRLKLGGVVDGDPETGEDGAVRFVITDYDESIPVTYKGVLPDLFKPGEMAIAEGYFDGTTFTADSVLAKHDEKYRPREVEDALREAGRLDEYEGYATN